MQTVFQEHAIHVMGIELRTSNEEAFRTIPGHWQRFSGEGIAQRVPSRRSEDVYAVYTDFENAGRDNEGVYSLVIGCAVDPRAEVPAGFTRVVVPAGRRAVFSVERGRFDQVGPAWQDIWRREFPRSYIADYERYAPDGTIEILVGMPAA